MVHLRENKAAVSVRVDGKLKKMRNEQQAWRESAWNAALMAGTPTGEHRQMGRRMCIMKAGRRGVGWVRIAAGRSRAPCTSPT